MRSRGSRHFHNVGVGAVLAIALPFSAFAHEGEPLQPHDLWAAWEFDPAFTVPLILMAVLYVRALRQGRRVARKHQVYFWIGWASTLLALVSPLHPLGESLFSAHMAQHEVLMLVAAPFLVASRAGIPMLAGMPLPLRRTTASLLRHVVVRKAWERLVLPAVATLLHGIAIWVWHFPSLFQATLDSNLIHAAQHLSFFITAMLFWWSMFETPEPEQTGASLLYVFVTSVHTSILGALLTFAPLLLYPAYAPRTAAWGLTPMQDLQLGGLIMWVPAGVVYLAIALMILKQWLQQGESLSRRHGYVE